VKEDAKAAVEKLAEKEASRLKDEVFAKLKGPLPDSEVQKKQGDAVAKLAADEEKKLKDEVRAGYKRVGACRRCH
jgi:hypothetical protein